MSGNHREGGSGTAVPALVCSLVAAVLLAPGCTEEAFLNATRPLRDGILINVDRARSGFLVDPDTRVNIGRNDLGVGFINRTPYRVIGTFGGYDLQDQDTLVTIGQLGVTAEFELEPNGVTPVLGISATRVFSVGGPLLLGLIYDNELQSIATALRAFPWRRWHLQFQFVPTRDLLFEGVGFSGAGFDDPQRWQANQGTAAPMIKWLGEDYQRDSILIFDFVEEPNAAGGFEIKFRTVRELGINPDRLAALTLAERVRYVERFGLDRQTLKLLGRLGAPTQPSPPATLVSQGPATEPAVVGVNNQTDDTLSAWFLGPESRVFTIEAGGSNSIAIEPGPYEFIIESFNANVRPLSGRATYEGGSVNVITIIIRPL